MFGIIRRDPKTVLVPPTTTLIPGRIILTGTEGLRLLGLLLRTWTEGLRLLGLLLTSPCSVSAQSQMFPFFLISFIMD